jgi:MFS transporter, SHS family, lactate transporter
MASQDGKLRDESPQNEFAESEKMSIGRYFATRLPTLKPPMAKAPNPLKLVRMLSLHQWLFFLVAFLAWTWDAFDFFTVSLTVEELSEEFGKTPSQITWGITLVLSTRSLSWAKFVVTD